MKNLKTFEQINESNDSRVFFSPLEEKEVRKLIKSINKKTTIISFKGLDESEWNLGVIRNSENGFDEEASAGDFELSYINSSKDYTTNLSIGNVYMINPIKINKKKQKIVAMVIDFI